MYIVERGRKEINQRPEWGDKKRSVIEKDMFEVYDILI